MKISKASCRGLQQSRNVEIVSFKFITILLPSLTSVLTFFSAESKHKELEEKRKHLIYLGTVNCGLGLSEIRGKFTPCLAVRRSF